MYSELITHFLRTVPIDDVMTHLARVSAFDRYQASYGIEQAASLVADTARAIGLTDVSIEYFPADGTAQWWSYKAPVSWTPVTARLKIRAADGRVIEIDHARQPFSIATYSAATPPDGLVAPLVNVRSSRHGIDLAGAIAVVGSSEFSSNDLLPDLELGGARGFVTDAQCCGRGTEQEYAGRIELHPGTALFGFSLTTSQLDLVRTWSEEGADAHVVIEIDRAASMPVVTGVLQGELPDEVWMIAHLCHPRPGANDNASGVAALLGVASAHVASRHADTSHPVSKTIRFLWGPEFLGTAAMLHRRTNLLGKAGLPSAVIDFDMVGEDQALCGCPFIVERSPDFRPSLISPISEHVVSQVFAQTKSHHGTWRSVPFTGFSDHALFADPNVGCDAVQLCHAPDRFNHSAGDTLDKVSRIEMLRASAAGAALARIMANDARPQRATKQIIQDWCDGQLAAARRIAYQYRAVDNGDWGRQFIPYVERRNAEMLSLLNDSMSEPLQSLESQVVGETDNPPMKGRWSGPLNIRALMADLPNDRRFEASDLIKADKFNYSLLLNFAIRANGRRSRREVINETSFACQRPLDSRIAERLCAILIESGWVTETPIDTHASRA